MQSLSTLDTILHRGRIRIPVVWWGPPEDGDPPEFYRDPRTGEPTGVVPELARVLSRDLGVQLELIETPWPLHMSALLDGAVDMLLSYTNTPRRALQLDFAGPLLPDAVSVLVAAESRAATIVDLNVRETEIGVSRGSSVADIAVRCFPHASIVELDEPFATLEGRQVAAIVEGAVTKPRLARHPTIRPLRDRDGRALVLGMEYGHPAIRQGDPRFLNWLNNWVEYHRAAGTVDAWCGSYWTRWMID